MKLQIKKLTGNTTNLLWAALGILFLAVIAIKTFAIGPDWLYAVPLGGMIIAGIALILVTSRNAAYGFNSIISTILIVGIVGVVNYISFNYPLKADLTKNKVHSLSDQTIKTVKGLQQPVKAIYYSKLPQREQVRPLLDNMRGLSTQFEVEYIDPDKEPTRAKQAGVRKYGTLQLQVGERDTKLEEVTEEKVTNALIKLLKKKAPVLCSLIDHGEKSFSNNQAEGFELAKKALNDQAYEVRDLSLIKEGKVPADCDAIAILGPTKAFFEQEVKLLREYLDNGGRALIAVDINLKGSEFSPELVSILKAWYVDTQLALVVDPLSRMLGVNEAVPILATYSKDHPITKEFQANSYFPFTRPVDVLEGAPPSLNVQWLAKTTPKSWAEQGLKQLAQGQAQFQQGQDKVGPINVAVAVQGKQKDSKAEKNTRLVVFGSSNFAANQYARFGGNMDLFLNSISWLMEDESLISIRAKEDGPGKVELSQRQGTVIYLLTVILIPLLTAVSGVVIWAIRRKL